MLSNHQYHRDSFGILGTAVTGVATWTSRYIRNTKISRPHIAKLDVFSYVCQLNHDKALETNLDGFHIHIIPVGAVAGGEVIALDYAWAWLTNGDIFPDTLPNTGTATITLSAGEQYAYLIKPIISDLDYPVGEGYSSEFYIQCTRRNDGQDTYASEFALIDGDVHYRVNRIGSYSEFNDTPTTTTTTTVI
jgi:hypothetical protein